MYCYTDKVQLLCSIVMVKLSFNDIPNYSIFFNIIVFRFRKQSICTVNEHDCQFARFPMKPVQSCRNVAHGSFSGIWRNHKII